MIKIVISLVFFYPTQAFAIHYAFPAKQIAFANFSIVPMAVLVFIISGAYSYYKRKADEAGTKRIGFGVAAFLILLSIFGVMLQGVLTIALVIYSGMLAVKMLRIKKDEAWPYTRRVAPVAGGILMLITAFLGTFPFVFSYGSYWGLHARWILDEGMPGFSEYQTAYAKDHKGVYRETVHAGQEKITFSPDSDEKGTSSVYSDAKSALHQFNQFCDPGVLRCAITYSTDLKSYEVRITPIRLPPWPYRLFDSPLALYMDQTGIIRYEEINEPGQEASAGSERF